MRILVTTTRGAGHFGPLLPFAEAFRRAGAEVLVAAPRSAESMVRGAGLPAWPLDEAPAEPRAAVFARARGLGDDEANALVVSRAFAGMDARAALPGVLAAVGGWRPDAIVHETVELAAPLAAELAGLPAVRVAISLSGSEERFIPAICEGLAAVRSDWGLPPDPDGDRLRRAPAFTLTPLALEDPSAPGPAGIQRFRDVDPPAAGPAADWAQGDGRPLVYVTFGSVAPAMDAFPSLCRAAIDAVAALPVRLLVTTGRGRDPADLGPLPSSVRAERWVPQAEVMPHAAMVCHGGFGTVRTGASAGVPMAVLPLFADQPYNARRIAALGAGIAVEGGPGGAAGLGDAVARLLDEPSYRAAAGRVAAEVRALAPVDEAAGVLRRLVGGAAAPG